MTDYLTDTLVPALHQQSIKVEDNDLSVEVRDEGNSGTSVYITLLGHGDTDWEIVATPGFDGATEHIPWVCIYMSGRDWDVFTNGQAMVEWTGDLESDIATYLEGMTTAIRGFFIDDNDPNWTEAWL